MTNYLFGIPKPDMILVKQLDYCSNLHGILRVTRRTDRHLCEGIHAGVRKSGLKMTDWSLIFTPNTHIRKLLQWLVRSLQCEDQLAPALQSILISYRTLNRTPIVPKRPTWRVLSKWTIDLLGMSPNGANSSIASPMHSASSIPTYCCNYIIIKSFLVNSSGQTGEMEANWSVGHTFFPPRKVPTPSNWPMAD